ncbi:Glucosyl-3-phosphoglycerate phosphatase [Sulfitobacter sp. THAF37]|uniref:histidine phosphatase family protein n=1 Tax=Sulfitobacter sp. THAF37 TaxID=2587855 RepID=UPI0012691E98|nr:histidine phosphatase family protein [Sulfitobacter sp. THAF37]QFT60170.1 Glucosyl-3-phosphoglycerate phosphatase [Sulfitobacter sp. THAF37]
MTPPPLYILRHGETTWNASGRLQGHFHADLTDQGRAQAEAQRRILAQRDLTGFQVISSPQGRAVQTARIVMRDMPGALLTDPALAEIGLGDWAGEDRADLIARTGARDGFELYELAPGGEGLAALHRRCTAFLAGLDRPSVLVTHGITSRMLRLILTGQTPSALREIGGGQGVVFHVAGGHQERLTLGA